MKTCVLGLKIGACTLCVRVRVWGGGSEEKSWIRLLNCVYRLRYHTEGDGLLKLEERVFCGPVETGCLRGKSEEKQTEARTVESKPKSRHSHKGAGGIYAELETNRRSHGERMTSEKYATAVVHYLR